MARYLTRSVVASKLFGLDILRFRSFLPHPPSPPVLYIYIYTHRTNTPALRPPTIGGESVAGAWKFARRFIPLPNELFYFEGNIVVA